MRQFLVLINYSRLTPNNPIACYCIQGSTALRCKSP